ncbi:MAG: protein-disulfide reductase DsbD [Candidatus Kuenenia sp.]|nr:protein-disulfide reductase DsbD [Candidatus Kuenenia hertensis]
MKTSIPKKVLYSFFLFILIQNVSSANSLPFRAHATAEQEEVFIGEQIPVTITIAMDQDHYIYKDQLRIMSGEPDRYEVFLTELPEGETKIDPFLEKEVRYYEGQVTIPASVQLSDNVPEGPYTIQLKVRYQGCSATICFAPKTEKLLLPLIIKSSSSITFTEKAEDAPRTLQEEETTSEVSDIQKTIEDKGIFLSFIFIFLAGIGLSFTPCVYPMIPITVAIIGGQATGEQQQGKRSPLRSFLLSLVYVLGISIVYSAMGVTAASTGALFGTALQSPWVIGFVVAVFVALAMSMFGVYYLRVPPFISNRLGGKTGKGVAGIFVMGLISGIVASPCIGPILASLLVYIASTGNKFLGFWMLFVFAWGLGVILIVLGTFSGAVRALPKSGSWMETVERIFGFLLIGAALYYLRLIIPQGAFIIILGVFLIVIAVFSGGFDRLIFDSSHFQRARKSFGLIAFIFGAYFLIGYLISKGFIVPPLFTSTTIQTAGVHKEEIQWVTNEKEGLERARKEGKAAIIDFWATWCSACMELEKITYVDSRVIEESKKFVNIKIDSTNSDDPEIKKLWKKYQIVGLPTILFVNKDGKVLKDKTITGFVNPEKYLRILKSVE